MPNDVTFALDPGVAPELALAAMALAEGLIEQGHRAEVLMDPWPETLTRKALVVDVGSEPERGTRNWHLDLGPRFELELVDPSDGTFAIPFALPSLPPRAAATARVLLVGGEAGRRTRMMSKTLEALKRHRDYVPVIWKPIPDEVLRHRFPGEVHPDIGSTELARLLGSCAALLDVSDEETSEGMLIAALGRASGVPTVLHRQFGAGRYDGALLVGEWSGEAFADGAIEASRRPRDAGAAAAVRKDAAQRLAGALS
jgi:hypothetical protein